MDNLAKYYKKFRRKYRENIYFKINTIIVSFCLLFTLLFLFVITPLQKTNFVENNLVVYKIDDYQTKVVKENEYNLEYPYFNSKKIDGKISGIIDKLKKENGSVTHETYIFNTEYTNIFFRIKNDDKTTYKSYFLSAKTGDVTDLSNIINNKDKFNEYIKQEFTNKYPKFIWEVLENNKTSLAFNFKTNEVEVYYSEYEINPEPTEEIFILVNYNEIHSYLDFTHNLDAEYQNQNKFEISKDKKTVAITFDDGPTLYRTEEILELLSDNKANATFFMLGSRIRKYPDLAKKVIESGNEVGNHSYIHKTLTKLKDKDLDYEILQPQVELSKVVDYNMTLARPPGGVLNEHVRSKYDYTWIMWSIDTRDWADKDAQKIKDLVLDKVKDGDIILMHDSYKTTTEAVRLLLPELYIRGYQVVSVSELAELKGINLEPQKVYRHFR